ncbi:hypothetical protein GW17_00057794 [Ensete ventricosum]|nr:hypothetical protein GW17_00057794 [Ensete ventricosum]
MIRITGSIEREARVVLWSPRDLKSAISLNRVACPLSVCSGTRHVDRYQAPAHFKSMRELDGRPFKIATSIRRRIIAETDECPSRHAGGGRVRPHDVPTSLVSDAKPPPTSRISTVDGTIQERPAEMERLDLRRSSRKSDFRWASLEFCRRSARWDFYFYFYFYSSPPRAGFSRTRSPLSVVLLVREMQTPLIAGEGSSSSGAGGWRGGAYQRRKSVPRRSDALTYGDNYQKAAALVDLVLPSFLPLIFIVYLV